MLFDGIETAKAAVAPGEFQCSAQGEDAGLASGGVKPQDENCATTAITVVTVMLVGAGHDSPSTSRVMISRLDCSASTSRTVLPAAAAGHFGSHPFPPAAIRARTAR
jgi:hypothetical protein